MNLYSNFGSFKTRDEFDYENNINDEDEGIVEGEQYERGEEEEEEVEEEEEEEEDDDDEREGGQNFENFNTPFNERYNNNDENCCKDIKKNSASQEFIDGREDFRDVICSDKVMQDNSAAQRLITEVANNIAKWEIAVRYSAFFLMLLGKKMPQTVRSAEAKRQEQRNFQFFNY